MASLRIAYLAGLPKTIPALAKWFAREWGDGRSEMAGAEAVAVAKY